MNLGISGLVAPPKTVLTAVKSSDQIVNNSTTLVNATELSAVVLANKRYSVVGWMLYNAPTAAIKFGWTGPTGAILTWKVAPTAGTVVSISGTDSSGAAAANRGVMIVGTLVVGSTGGTLQLQFAQNALAAEDTKLMAHSTLTIIEL